MSSFSQPLDPVAALSQIHRVYQFYRALVASSPLSEDSGLGGKLLFAGGLHASSRDLLYAANIAGAASVAASCDAEQQRSAIRDGVVDFVVTSLAEALRILKNEVRKSQAVSVGIAADPRRIVAEMLDRGVLPDLLFESDSVDTESALMGGDRRRFLEQGALAVGKVGQNEDFFISWTVNHQHARWLPRLDLGAQSVLPPDDLPRHRWVRLSPRYLGRLAQRVHAVSMTGLELARFRDRASLLVAEQVEKENFLEKEPVVVSIQPVRAFG